MHRDESDQQYTRQLLNAAKVECAKRITYFRSKPWSEDEITRAILGLGTPEGRTSPWRSELLYMLSVCEGEPLSTIYAAIGVTGKQVMSLRRKDEEVAEAIKDYLGAYFEDEAMLPQRAIRPQVIAVALGAHAHGWNTDTLASLTPERMQTIIRAIIDAVRGRVTDPEVQRQIGEDIKSLLARGAAPEAKA